MPDHVHRLPVCGFGAHNPHDPSCTQMRGVMIGCGTTDDPAFPHPGMALCRHRPRPVFKPKKWNDNNGVELANNCYNYATDMANGSFARPGRGGGYVMTAYNCIEFIKAAVEDGLKPTDPDAAAPHDCDLGCPSQCWKVMLVLALNPRDRDFHWYRQDEDGTWSHKQGGFPATNRDASGNPITDPRTADRDYRGRGLPNYETVCGCFCVCPPVAVAGLRTVRYEGMALRFDKPTVEVTLLAFSGLDNPTWALTAKEVSALKSKLKSLKTTKPKPRQTLGLVLRSFGEVKGFPAQVRVQDGIVEITEGKKVIRFEDHRGLMEWLFSSGLRSSEKKSVKQVWERLKRGEPPLKG